MTPSPLRLRVLATRSGAQCVFKMSPAVTHVILDPTKTAHWRNDDSKIHIVRPQWIVDCFHSQKRLDECNYSVVNDFSQQQQQQQSVSIETTRFKNVDSDESAAITRLHAIEMLLNEKLPSSPEAFLNKADYYQYTREGRMCVAKSLLRWRFLSPKPRLTRTSFKGSPFVKYKNTNDAIRYTTIPVIYNKQQLTQQVSTWKLEMTDYLLTHPPAGPTPIHMKDTYTFCHICIDAFFISSSLNALPPNERARLIGAPVIVVANQSTNTEADDRAIIIDCTAAAKQMGVNSGMLTREALELCPNIHILHYDTDAYNIKGQELFRIFAQFSADIMPMNYNEVVLDLSGHVTLSTVDDNNSNCLEFGAQLQQRIAKETGLYCSIGFGDSFLTAQIATKLAGSNGIFSAVSSLCWTFLTNRPLSFLPGVSPEIERQFAEQLGITKCGEILGIPLVDICQVIGIVHARQLVSIMKGQSDDAAKGFFPVRTEINRSSNHKIFLNALESKQIHKKSTESLASKVLKRLSIRTKNIPGQLYSLQDEEHLAKSISPLITELYLRMLRHNLSLTSETQLIVTIQVRQSTSLPHVDQNECSIDHCSISATTEIFTVSASSNPEPDYQILKSATRRCVKDLWSQAQHNLLAMKINCSSNQKINEHNEQKPVSIFKTLPIRRETFNILHEISSTLSYLALHTGAVDDSECSNQELSDSGSSNDAFKEWCEPEKPLDTNADAYNKSISHAGTAIQPLTHYTRAYSMPSRAYEHTCLFSTDVETRVKDYQSAIDVILSRDVPGESNETHKRLLHTALHSFVVQLCYDGDLEGILYLFKKYQFTKETCEYVNNRFSAKIL